MFTTKMLSNSNSANGDLLVDLLKYWSEYKGKAVAVINSGCETNEDNNLTTSTAISNHLQSCDNIELKDEFKWEINIGDSIEEPKKVVEFRRTKCNNLVQKNTWKLFWLVQSDILLKRLMKL